MRGRNDDLVCRSPPTLLAHPAREVAEQQWDAEEDQDRRRDLPRRDVEGLLRQAEPAGQHRQVEPAERPERDDLEDRVERHEHRGGLAVATGEVVPDDDHRDAPGQPDDDQPGAVLGQVVEEHPGEGEHQGRPDDPVEHQAGDEHRPVAGDRVEPVVAHLGEHRVHHHEQPERDRQRDAAHLDRRQRPAEPRHDPAEGQAGEHRQADPDREEPVEGRQPGRDVVGRAAPGRQG